MDPESFGYRLGTGVLDVVYPPRCAGCGRRGDWLCANCEAASAGFQAPLCGPCGVPLALGACRCSELPADIAQVRSVGAFQGWLRESVIRVKYHGEWARVRHLAPWLAAACQDLLPVDAFVPVPLHASRQRQRGFNQSEKLAQAVGSVLDVPVSWPVQRVRKTTSQVRLNAAGRQNNVQGAFRLVDDAAVRGRRLVLVDDVITTGATLGACAEVLMAAGASQVSVLTVTRELS